MVGSLSLLGLSKSDAQNLVNTAFRDQRAITTAVPFLMISPDARTGALGDAGVALPDNLNAIHWNAAMLPFNEKKGAVSLSYTPWLRALVPDVSLSYLSVYGKINDRSAIAGSLRYFSLGEIQFTDIVGNSLGNFTPNEFAADVAYAQKLSEKFSVGIAFRYIYSNLAGGFNQSQTPIHAGVSYAGDISCYYKDDTRVKGYKVNYGFGAAATNLGAKVTYTSSQYANFIPMNLRVGSYGQVEIDKYNTIALLLDLDKLMVPTNPVYATDASGNVQYNSSNQPVISKGMNPNVPVIQGMFQSFYDSPGGFSEEMSEINISTGIEYWYDKQFALRTGYFYENPNKGNRKYMTFGMGIKYNVFGLDAAYLISFGQRNPLDNTLRFTFTFDFDAFRTQNKNTEEKKDVFETPAN
ncbi:MAG: type IX secretion system outer membrane channel protein PorV [Bacteroidia bacterium]